MYIIDGSYFIKDYLVPGMESNPDAPINNNSFEVYIDKYARLLLQNALGNVLYDELDGELETNKLSVKDSAPQKWKDLVTGKSYTKDGVQLKWKGLQITEGTFKSSVLVPFTYYHWMIDQLSETSLFGEVKGSAVNSLNVSSDHKLVKTWNDYVEMYQGSEMCSDPTPTIYRGVEFIDYFGARKDYVSLITYLKDHDSDFPDANLYLEQGYQNSLGL